MDWLIWVIVIVLIVAIVWWLLSRNNAKSSSASKASASPAASSPAASSPQMDVAAAALTGSAPLVAASATADQELAESRAAEPEPEPEPEPELEPQAEPEPGPKGSSKSNGLDVDDWERPVPPLEAGTAAREESSAAGTSVNEPVVEEPRLSEPVLSEDAVSEELEGGVTADDVTAADSAEWEATWSEGGVPAAPAPAPVHHREYTDAHAPTLPGAESAAAEAAEAAESDGEPGQATSARGGHLAAEQPYGEGSAAAGPDGSGPEGYTVKGNADTMTYHDEDSPSYDEAKAEVWFISSAHAEAAGFRPPRRNRR